MWGFGVLGCLGFRAQSLEASLSKGSLKGALRGVGFGGRYSQEMGWFGV